MFSILTHRSVAWAGFAFACALLAGCGNDGEKEAGSTPQTRSYSEGLHIVALPDGQALEYAGVRFETPPSSSENRNSISASNGNLAFKAGGISATFENGQLSVEGEPYGRIHRGDVVKLTADGAVSVNGKGRKKLTLTTSNINGVRFVHYGNLFRDFHFSSDDGSLVIGGRSYGKVKRGDEVRCEIDGTIRVNGEARPPQ